MDMVSNRLNAIIAEAVHYTDEGFSIVDISLPDQPLIFVNKAFARITGYSKEEILGKNCRFLQGKDSRRDANKRIKAAIARREGCTIELLNYRKNGERFWNRLTITPIHLQNEPEVRYYAGVQVDITALIEANKALELANEAKQQLFSIIAHDIRGPISSLKQIIDSTKQGLDIDPGEAMQMITQQVGQVHQLVDNLLNWSLNNLERIQYRPEEIELSKLVTDIIELVASETQQKHIDVWPQITEGLSLYADREMLHAVMRNLLTNAIKFSPRNSSIVLRANKVSEQIQIAVEDEGQGFSEEALTSLRSNKMPVTSIGINGEQGFGLGLSICHAFVEKNNGSMSFSNNEKGGANVTMAFPAKSKSLQRKLNS